MDVDLQRLFEYTNKNCSAGDRKKEQHCRASHICISIFLIIRPTRCTNFSKVFLFWNESLHVSDSSSVHHQEFSTVHTAMVYVIQFCRQLARRIRMEHPDTAHKLPAKVYDIYLLLCVQWRTPDDGQRNCPKHVEFYSKIKNF
jgi:hypothetical protein